MMTRVEGPVYRAKPEHGVERHRIGERPVWTPDLRRQHTEASIRLLAERLERPFNPDGMARIIEEADLVPQLGGMYNTLLGPDGESYARKAIVWALEGARRKGVQLESETEDLAGKFLPVLAR